MKKIYETPVLSPNVMASEDVLTLSFGENGRDDERSWSEGI